MNIFNLLIISAKQLPFYNSRSAFMRAGSRGVPSAAYWDFCSLIAGLAFTLAFSPYDYDYLAFAALAFLILVTINSAPKRAFLRGYLFGLGTFGLGVSWVFISLHEFGGASILISVLLTSLFVAFWAIFPAIAVYLAAMVPIKNETGRILLFSSIWILVEYFRGEIVLNGFPWLQIAYSQLDTPLAGYIPLVGSYGTGLITLLMTSILLLLFRTKNLAYFLAAAIVLLWGVGFVLKTVKWTHPVGSPIKATLIQGNISQDKKWLPEYRLNTLSLYKSLTEQHWDSDVIVWPETSIPAYLDEVKDFFILPLSDEAKRRRTDLVVSVPLRDTEKGEKYNAVITLGKHENIYRKIHLLPFGEYLPWQPFSGFILRNLKLRLGNFTSGSTNQPLLKAGGYPFITSICYEDVFGEIAAAGMPDAAYLVNVTNDGWFGDSVEPYQHMQLARMRAMETGRYLLRATNTGLTAMVSPDGVITAQAPLFMVIALTGDITPMGGMTPYARIGDTPVIFFIGAMLIICLSFNLIINKKRGNQSV